MFSFLFSGLFPVLFPGFWYNISVLFEEEELRGLLFTGNLKRYDDINVFFDALTRTGDIKYRVDGNHVILYK